LIHEFAITIPANGRSVPRPRSGGKQAADRLLKPVTSKKRVAFLRWVLTDPAGRAIADAMTEFNFTRQNVVTLCGAIQREHGIGYEIADNRIRPLIPQGWTPENIFGGPHGA
jgi:hypothetical protein